MPHFKFDKELVKNLAETEKAAKNKDENVGLILSLSETSTAKEFRNFTSAFLFDLSASMESLKLVPGLMAKLDTHLKNHETLLAEVTTLRNTVSELEKNKNANLTEINNLSSKVDTQAEKIKSFEEKIADYKLKVEDCESKCGKIKKLEETVSTLEGKLGSVDTQAKKITSLEQRVASLEGKAKESKKACLALERHSRSWNLRLMNKKDNKDEKSSDSMNTIISTIKEVTGMDFHIEYGHRTGKFETGKDRSLIFRCLTRQDKFALLAHRKKFFEAGYPIFEDLPAEDLNEKKRLADVMQIKFNNKEKVAFRRGQWFVNGKVYEE